MLGKSPLVAFIATERPEQAKQFYEKTIGLRLVSDDPFAVVFDANGTMLRIQKAQAVTIAPYTSLGWNVDDIAKTVAALAERGVNFARYPGMEQDAQGVWSAPSGAKIAWFKDPDGNTLSLTQF